jgi:hypothetical protein
MSAANERRVSIPATITVTLVTVSIAWAVLTLTSGLRSSFATPNDEFYPKREVWTPVHGNSANVSHFIYRDMNRNGIYDAGDRPMAGIAVRLVRPDGTSVVRRTNIHGFANFTNSLTASPVDVYEEGEHVFEVLVPDGWGLTSGNRVQSARYEARTDARPGIVVDRVPIPAGLVPVLSIEGQVLHRSPSGERRPEGTARIRAQAPDGEAIEVRLDRAGRFSIPAEPGVWTLEVNSSRATESVTRSVEVDRAPVHLSAIVIGDPHRPAAQHQIRVDLDNVGASRITKMPDGVGGVKWSNLIPVANDMYGGEGYINNTVSGSHVAYNTSGYPVTIEHPSGFDFVGGYFGVAWPAAEGERLEVQAWRGGDLVGEESFELSFLGPFWFQADYRGITRLELSTAHYWQFVGDDFVLRIGEAPLSTGAIGRPPED